MGERKDAAREMSWSELLNQDRWWRTSDGEMVRLDRMTPSHQMNLLALLLRNAKCYAYAQMSVAFQMGMSIGDDPSDGMFWAHESIMGEAEDAIDDPDAWMRSKPLYMALAAFTVVHLTPTQTLMGGFTMTQKVWVDEAQDYWTGVRP